MSALIWVAPGAVNRAGAAGAIRVVRPDAGLESGLAEIKAVAERLLLADEVPAADKVGQRSSRDLLEAFQDHVKSGVRGIGFVRSDPAADWPADLAVRLPE